VRRTRRPVTDMRGWGRRRQASLRGWLRVEVQYLVANIFQDFRLKIPNIKIPPVLVLVCFPSPVLHFKLAQLCRKIHQSNGDYFWLPL